MSISIQFSNPHGVYYPGTEVAGVAILQLDSSVKARSVCVQVDGRAHNHWTESESHTHRNADGTTYTETRTIHYSATVIYATGEAVVWSSAGGKLDVGRHEFPFRFIMPVNCAPSFEGCYGYIRYQVIVEIDRVWKFNKSNRRLFTVAPSFDLNQIPRALTPLVDIKCKDVGFVLFRHGKISVEARLPKSGFVPGETIVIDATIDNGSSRPVISADLKLKQTAQFIAARSGWSAHYCVGLHATGCHHTRQQRREVGHTLSTLNLAPKTSATVQFKLQVPPTVASFNVCPIITVDYYVTLKLTSKGNMSNTIKNEFPVLIGTIPIVQRTVAPAVIPATPGSLTVYPTIPLAPSPNSPTTSADDAPPPYVGATAPPAGMAPPSYEESVYGAAGTTKDMENAEAFAPRYPFYTNLGSAPSTEQAPPIGFKTPAS